MAGYKRNSTGQKEMFVDFRSSGDTGATPTVESGHLWVDQDFGPANAIRGVPYANAVAKGLDWRRPKEIRDSPALFTQGRSRYDIGQGEVGTCWFLCAVSTIADNDLLLNKVIPPNSYSLSSPNYDGKFYARFWQFGDWEDVYIDDRLPVIFDGKTIWGARSASDKNEMWISLLEKAFAKFHGSYNDIEGGQAGDAYVTLTGGLAESIKHEEITDRDKFYNRIQNALKSGCQVASGVPARFDGSHGLQGNHAYSMHGAAQVRGEKLLRLRNPWGNEEEWKGRWRDGGPEWTGVSSSEVPHATRADGEFWISFNDFMTYFDETSICSLTPDFDQDGRTDSLDYVLNMYGKWEGASAAGFQNKLRNPKYVFKLPDSGEDVPVVVQLIQKRASRKAKNDQIRCDLFKIQGGTHQKLVLENMGTKTNSYTDAAQRCFRFRLGAGNYCVVPSTGDAGIEREFLIRVFSPVALTDVREMDRNMKLVSYENQPSLTYNGVDYPLSYTWTEFGVWRSGKNAGGHIGHYKTHDINPQYRITISQGRDTLVMFRVLQDMNHPASAVGLWLYSVNPNERIPLSYEQIYDKQKGGVSEVMTTIDGEDNKYIRGYDFDATYFLPRGDYVLLVHTQNPGQEGEFTLLIRSTQTVRVIAYQNGA